MMRFEWLKNQDNITYVKVDEFAKQFGKQMKVDNLREILDDFKRNPAKEGLLVKGNKRSTFKLFIPDLYFEDQPEKLDMGDSVWVYIGDLYPCYCVYWPR